MLPQPNRDQEIKVMSAREQADAEARWQRSEEKRLLDEKRSRLISAIAERTAGYSRRA
jgi:hypothetical protein